MVCRQSVFSFTTLFVVLALVVGVQAQDNCASAVAIGNGTTNGSNVGATSGPDPLGSCGAMGNDVWFSYTATCTGTVLVSLCGSGYDTVAAAWSGTCGALAQLACNDDSCGLQSNISFAASSGTTYYISIGGFAGSQGNFTMNVSCTGPIQNDTCATAITIIESVVTSSNNLGATAGPDPLPACGFAPGTDVWYVIVPTCTATYTATTCQAGTTFDTVLGVWGGSCGGLAAITCNDDNCANFGFLSSTVTWSATAGVPYYISVAGYNGGVGTFDLLVTAGGGMVLTINTPAASCIGYTVTGGPQNGAAFTAITLTAGAYPNDWFYGIQITLQDLANEINTGFPFVTGLSSCGSGTVGPFCGAPAGLTIYGVSLGVPSGSSWPTVNSPPATGTVF
jgi:hypothetical protein